MAQDARLFQSPTGADWWTPPRFALILAAAIFASFPLVALGLKSFFYRDFGVLAYPFVHYHHASFWRGELPLWNPYSNCGAPFLAQWGTLVLYPFSTFYCLFPLPWSLNFFSLAHLFLGGMGMYFLARQWWGHGFPAAAAGFVFVFNGAILSSLTWPNYGVALGWLPWVVWLTGRAWREGGKWIILSALASALQMLSGVPEILLCTWLFLAALLLQDVLRNPARKQFVARFFLIVLLVTGLTAVQLLPFWDLLQHSQRDRHFSNSKWSMPGWGWGNFLVPLYHYFQTPQGTYFQWDQAFIPTYYLGLAPLLLAIRASARFSQPRIALLGLATLATLVLALGDEGYFYPLLRKIFPFLGVGRYLIKFVFFTAFLVPLLGAVTLVHLETDNDAHGRAEKKWLTIIAAVIGLLALAVLWTQWHNPFYYDQWKLTFHNEMMRVLLFVLFIIVLLYRTHLAAAGRKIIAGILLLFLVWLDIHSHLPNHNPAIDNVFLLPGSWQALDKSAPPEPSKSRVFISRQAEAKLLFSEVPDLKREFIGKRFAQWSNLNVIEKIAKVNGSSTLQAREQAEVQSMIYQPGATNDFSRLLDFLGVSHEYVVTNGQMAWVQRPQPLPLLTAGQRPVFADGTNALALWQSPGFNPRTEAILPSSEEAALRALASGTTIVPPKISNPIGAAHHWEMNTEATGPFLLLCAQSYYHNWKPYVDGQRSNLLRVNHAFQGVLVPGGSHQVELKYEDHYFFIGKMISGISLLLCLGLWMHERKKEPAPIPASTGITE